MKKSLFIFGLANAMVASSVVASAAASLGQPTVNFTLNNNSSQQITKGRIDCPVKTDLPGQIPAYNTLYGSSRSSYNGVIGCVVEYKTSSGQRCSFTVSRYSSVGNPMMGTKDRWNAPTIYLKSGSSSQCSGRVTYATQSYSGDFDVELNFKL